MLFVYLNTFIIVEAVFSYCWMDRPPIQFCADNDLQYLQILQIPSESEWISTSRKIYFCTCSCTSHSEGICKVWL